MLLPGGSRLQTHGRALPTSPPWHWPPFSGLRVRRRNTLHLHLLQRASHCQPLLRQPLEARGERASERRLGACSQQHTLMLIFEHHTKHTLLLSDRDSVRCCSKSCRQQHQPLDLPSHLFSPPARPARDTSPEPSAENLLEGEVAQRPVTLSLWRVEITRQTLTRKRSGSFSEQNHSILPTTLQGTVRLWAGWFLGATEGRRERRVIVFKTKYSPQLCVPETVFKSQYQSDFSA